MTDANQENIRILKMDGWINRTFVPDESHVGVEHHQLPAGVFELLRPGPPERCRCHTITRQHQTKHQSIVVHSTNMEIAADRVRTSLSSQKRLLGYMNKYKKSTSCAVQTITDVPAQRRGEEEYRWGIPAQHMKVKKTCLRKRFQLQHS